MSPVHFRDNYAYPSGVCGAGWQDGKDDAGEAVKATRTESRVDCPDCLSSMNPGRRVVRHGRITFLFDADNLLGNLELRLRGPSADNGETRAEVPLMHVLGASMKLLQSVAEVGGPLLPSRPDVDGAGAG